MSTDANKDAREAMLSGADKLVEWGQPSYAELIAETERGIAELKRHLSERGHWPTTQPPRPAGWSFVANQDGSVIVQGPNGGCVVREDATEARTIPEAVLWELANTLARAPAPAPAPMVLDVRCDFCDGSGLDSRDSNYECAPCNGRGFIERKFAAPAPALVPLTEHWGRDDLMAMAAVRYCLGRMSYIVGDCCDWLRAVWPHLSPNIRKIIARDVDEAFARDDEARERGDPYKPLGMDVDRAQWTAIRVLWSGGQA